MAEVNLLMILSWILQHIIAWCSCRAGAIMGRWAVERSWLKVMMANEGKCWCLCTIANTSICIIIFSWFSFWMSEQRIVLQVLALKSTCCFISRSLSTVTVSTVSPSSHLPHDNLCPMCSVGKIRSLSSSPNSTGNRKGGAVRCKCAPVHIQYSWFEWPDCSQSLVHLPPLRHLTWSSSHSQSLKTCSPAINMSLSSPKRLPSHANHHLFSTASLKMRKVLLQLQDVEATWIIGAVQVAVQDKSGGSQDG